MQRLLLFPSSPFLPFVLLVALKQTITVGAALVELEYYSVSLVIIQHTTYTAISSNKISEDQLEDHHENKDTGQIGKTWEKNYKIYVNSPIIHLILKLKEKHAFRSYHIEFDVFRFI